MALATGEAPQHGVLVKNGSVWEHLGRVRTVALDKTGTITQGKPRVTAAHAFGPVAPPDVLRWAATAEQGSHHPLAHAIRLAATAAQLTLPALSGFDELEGQGIQAQEGSHVIWLGNQRLMDHAGVAVHGHEALAEEVASAGGTPVWVAVDLALVGLLGISDPMRPEAARVVAELQRRGIRVVMLTGDHPATAQRAADLVGVAEVQAGMLPAGKADAIRRLQADTSGPVLMVGDGVNDAPALAAADIGAAMGSGSEIAGQAAAITLLHSDLGEIPAMLSRGQFTARVIRQNFFWAFIFNGLGLPVAALGYLSPVLASGAMGLSSFAVVANSMRRRTTRPPRAGAAPR